MRSNLLSWLYLRLETGIKSPPVEIEAKPKQKFIKIFFWTTKYCDLCESGNRPQIIGIAGGIRNIFCNDQSWSHLEQYYHGHGVSNFTIGPQLYSLSL